jgi:hypothetical protein
MSDNAFLNGLQAAYDYFVFESGQQRAIRVKK